MTEKKAKRKVQVELKELIDMRWREHIEWLLKKARTADVAKIISNMHSDEKKYSEMDFWRWQIAVYNAILKLPERSVTIEEEYDIEEETEKELQELDIGDEDDLFKSQE